MIRSEDDAEIVATSQKHVKDRHNMNMERDEIMKSVKPFNAPR